MRVVGMLQARMATPPLPGKALYTVGGQSVIGMMAAAASASGALDALVVTTGSGEDDDPIAAECARLGLTLHRGPAGDAVEQAIGALLDHPADAVLRLDPTGPLLDPRLIAVGVRVIRESPALDYVSTTLTRLLPLGMDVEVVAAAAIHRLADLATGAQRADLTAYLRSHLEEFQVMGLMLPPDRSSVRLSLQTMEDWALVSMVVSHFGAGQVSVAELVDWLDANPAVRALNARVA